jgi:hypothetical protein
MHRTERYHASNFEVCKGCVGAREPSSPAPTARAPGSAGVRNSPRLLPLLPGGFRVAAGSEAAQGMRGCKEEEAAAAKGNGSDSSAHLEGVRKFCAPMRGDAFFSLMCECAAWKEPTAMRASRPTPLQPVPKGCGGERVRAGESATPESLGPWCRRERENCRARGSRELRSRCRRTASRYRSRRPCGTARAKRAAVGHDPCLCAPEGARVRGDWASRYAACRSRCGLVSEVCADVQGGCRNGAQGTSSARGVRR